MNELKTNPSQVLHDSIENLTQTIGRKLQPIASHPVVEGVTRIPWLKGLLVWMGRVDTVKALADVEALRREYPTDSDDAIARRIIADTAFQAGRVGLLTNIIPPVALALMAVDLAAITKLQAEMLYRLAAAYRLDLNDPTRQGEVVTMYGFSFGSSTPLKAGLSIFELIPGFGAIVGASSNAILLYGLGEIARQFYERKQKVNVAVPLNDLETPQQSYGT